MKFTSYRSTRSYDEVSGKRVKVLKRLGDVVGRGKNESLLLK